MVFSHFRRILGRAELDVQTPAAAAGVPRTANRRPVRTWVWGLAGLAVLAVVLCCFGSETGETPQWSAFRGGEQAGVAADGRFPVTWSDADYLWRVELPGIGCSSPVVWDQRIFVTTSDEESATRFVRCLSTADGSLLWERAFATPAHPKHPFNAYAASTPAVDGRHLYYAWATPEEYVVVALAVEDGREVWRYDLGPFQAEHGFGASPVLFEDLVVVVNEQDGPSSVVALDRQSGAVRWIAPRRSERASYATPLIYRPHTGPPQLVLASTAHGVSALCPRTGEALWEVDCFDARVVGSPIAASGLIFAGCGEGGGGRRVVAIRPGDHNGRPAELAYEIKGSLPYVPTPVTHGRLLFLVSDQGVVTGIDAPTGDVLWRQRAGGRFFGSPIRVGEQLYCMSRDGRMVVLAAAASYRLLGEVDLGEPSESSPAVADRVMYLQTHGHLMALRGR